jgi:hypothetical protein
MLKFIKERVELWKFQRTPLAQAIQHHTQTYWSLPSLASVDPKTKEKLISEFCQRLGLIYASPNPVMACRETLAECTLLFTQLQIHCLTESEKADNFYSANPYISGQIWRHVRQSSDHHDDMARWKFEDPEMTDEELIATANTRCALLLYYANGVNIVRRELGDFSEEKDWFRPFVEACLVNEEHLLREKIGLPALVPDKMLGSLVYAGFLNYVLNGEQNPFFAWTRDFPDAYLAGEGPPPKLATAAE